MPIETQIRLLIKYVLKERGFYTFGLSHGLAFALPSFRISNRKPTQDNCVAHSKIEE